jgi:ClpP class serine protease
MKSNAIVNAMFMGLWHVSNSHVEGLHQAAQLYLENKFEQAEKPEQFFKIENATEFADSNRYDNVPVLLDNGVLVFPIIGTIIQSDYCWSAGTETMTQWIKSAQADKRVKAILLYINSGGGQSAGTWEFANAIAEVNKPKMALGKGTVGSAAYYIAAAADIIYVTSPDVIVGSIGTVFLYRKANDYYQYIYADTSGQKHGGHRAMENNNDSTVIKENILNPLDKNFMDVASSHRPQLSADALDGLEVALPNHSNSIAVLSTAL